MTTREAVEEATKSETDCQGCHHLMNPLGFASENYDPLGRFRDKELRFADNSGEVINELAIDTSVQPQLLDGDAETAADAIEMSSQLAASGKAHTCLVRNYFQYVTGREGDAEADGCDMVSLREELTQSGGSIRAMLETSVMQDSFRRRKVQ